jgi:hypothetical protein
MITLHEAIYSINPSIVTIRGDIAYDANEQEVTYNKSLAETKLTELQAQETQAEQAQATAKASALAKLTALGLTQDEIKALVG